MTSRRDRLIEDYLHRLDNASVFLAADRRAELRQEIVEHIDAGLEEADALHAEAVRVVLDRLGPPADIVAAELSGPRSTGSTPVVGQPVVPPGDDAREHKNGHGGQGQQAPGHDALPPVPVAAPPVPIGAPSAAVAPPPAPGDASSTPVVPPSVPVVPPSVPVGAPPGRRKAGLAVGAAAVVAAAALVLGIGVIQGEDSGPQSTPATPASEAPPTAAPSPGGPDESPTDRQEPTEPGVPTEPGNPTGDGSPFDQGLPSLQPSEAPSQSQDAPTETPS